MNNRINAGRMRETITIEQPGTPGTLGQPTWVTFVQTRAELMPVSGRELDMPQVGGSETTHKFILRYSDNTAATKGNMRVKVASLGDRIFMITHVLAQYGNREIFVFCKEVMTV